MTTQTCIYWVLNVSGTICRFLIYMPCAQEGFSDLSGIIYSKSRRLLL